MPSLRGPRSRDSLIPMVLPFRIPSLNMWFLDKRSQSESDWEEALSAINNTVIVGWSRRLGQREWCKDTPRIENSIKSRRRSFFSRNPDATLEDFRESGEEFIDSYCHDRRRATIRLIARSRIIKGPIVGGAILMNIDILNRTRRRIGIRYTPIMGIGHRRFSLPRVWGEWGSYTSQNDIKVAGRGALALEEVVLPSTVDMTFAPQSGAMMNEMWTRLSPVMDQESSDGEVPDRLRAKRNRLPGGLDKPIVVRPHSKTVR